MPVKFDNFDELFFEIILSNSTLLKDAMNKSMEYKLNITKEIEEFKTNDINVEYKGKTSKHSIFLFSMYDVKKQKFIWFGKYNVLFKEFFEKYDIEDIFGSYKTIDKIFDNDEFEISEKYHIVVPYLMAMVKDGINLVSFEVPNADIYLYAFINLDIKDNFDMKQFINNMQYYKKALETNVIPTNLSRLFMNKSKRKNLKKTNKLKE